MSLAARIDRRSIEARVLILQLAGWLTLVALVGVTAWTSSRELSAVAAARQQQLARVVAHQIDQIVAADLARVQALSGRELGSGRAVLAAAFHDARLIESVRLIDRTGEIVLQEPSAAPAAPIDAALVRQAFEGTRLRAAPVAASELRAEVLVPLRDGQGGVRALAGVILNPQARSVRDLLAHANARLSATDVSPGAVGAPLALVPWTVVVTPEDAGDAPWTTLAWTLTASLALALLFAWGTARSVRRPALALTAAAERMAAGDLDTPLPSVPDGDEIGRLARVLERMRVALHRDAWRRHTLRKVISAQEEERRRLARELHDDTAQALAAVGVGLDSALHVVTDATVRARLDALKQHVNQSLADLHRVIYDLRPSVLDDLGLAAAIRWLADEHLHRTGVTVRVECYGLDRRLPSDIETAVFRVVQEALSNIERHAQAETVLAQIALEQGTLSVDVEDDGRGFRPATVDVSPGSARGLGLQGMRERVELLGGTYAITSAPGRGTRITMTVPI